MRSDCVSFENEQSEQDERPQDELKFRGGTELKNQTRQHNRRSKQKNCVGSLC